MCSFSKHHLGPEKTDKQYQIEEARLLILGDFLFLFDESTRLDWVYTYVGRYQEQPVIEFVCLLGPALVRRMDTGTGEKREKCSEVLMRHRPRVREHVSSAGSRDVRRVIASVCPVPRSMLHYYNTTQCNTPPTHTTCPAHV